MVVDPDVDRAIARLVRSQNGAIGHGQLAAAGLTRSALRARLARGALVRAFLGVYIAGDPDLLPLARPSAALLSLGRGALISHRSAASLWGLALPDPQGIDVTLVARRVRARGGVRLHWVARLDPTDVRTLHNLKLTAPARTLIDFAAHAGLPELESAFGEARAKRLIAGDALDMALRRAPRTHPGAARVRSLLASDEGATYTRSEAEAVVRRLIGSAQLPQPLVNVRLVGFTVDFLWPAQRLVLEVDGYATHGARLAFERDRRRDQILTAAGYTIIRVTWRQLRDEPLAVIARIAQALSQRAA